ncbi:MAG TPA: alpha/beta hydrolase [Candidatus Hydrogenedentes bacterium]|nr:alpha/beta hydrolase [Candidatus Hydrogenedentota bacterium]
MLLVVLRTLALIYIGLVVLAWAAQRKLIFPASRGVHSTPASYGWNYEEKLLPVMGKITQVWFIPVEDARGTFLISHGNAGNIADRLDSAELFRSMGFNVVLYDYGGYGNSTGKPSEKRCYADIRAVWRYLTEEQGIPPHEIVLFGRSLGGAVTCDLAPDVEPGAVIIESTFTAMPALAQEVYPFLPAKYLVRHKFNSAEKIGRITAPVLIIHSPDDGIIPYHHGTELYERANEPKQFLEIQGSHNYGFVQSMALYKKGIDDFLRTSRQHRSVSGKNAVETP